MCGVSGAGATRVFAPRWMSSSTAWAASAMDMPAAQLHASMRRCRLCWNLELKSAWRNLCCSLLHHTPLRVQPPHFPREAHAMAPLERALAMLVILLVLLARQRHAGKVGCLLRHAAVRSGMARVARPATAHERGQRPDLTQVRRVAHRPRRSFAGGLRSVLPSTSRASHLRSWKPDFILAGPLVWE